MTRPRRARARSRCARSSPTHGGDVELLDIDADAGAVHLRLLGSCDGCPSSAVTLQLAVERAIVEAAPEIVRIDVDGRRRPAGRRSRSSAHREAGAATVPARRASERT